MRVTFDLQVDVVLIDSQVVCGHAGVLPAVVRLNCMNLQRAVVVVDVRVSNQRAGPTVFEPGHLGEGGGVIFRSGVATL